MFFRVFFAFLMTLALNVAVMGSPSMVGRGDDVRPASASLSTSWSSGWWKSHHKHHRTSGLPTATLKSVAPTPQALIVKPIDLAPTPDAPTVPLSADAQAYLDAHNAVRAQHNAVNLTWSTTLSNVAQLWADECQFMHSNSAFGPYGENLAAGTQPFTPEIAVQVWAAEASEYDPANATASHFTQIVWKNTTELGCAWTTCNNIFPADVGVALYHVCEYSAAGNVIGQFAENVEA